MTLKELRRLAELLDRLDEYVAATDETLGNASPEWLAAARCLYKVRKIAERVQASGGKPNKLPTFEDVRGILCEE